MKRPIHEFVDHLTHVKIDGVSNIVRSRYSLLSFVWLLILCGNAFVCVWLIRDTFVQYNEHRVTTTIRYLTEQKSTFPTLIICNINAFSTDYANSLLTRMSITSSERTKLGTLEGNFRIFNKLQAYLNATRGYMLTDNEKMQLSDLNLMIISCSFHGIVCNASDFEFFFHPYYLNCYSFNADGSIQMSSTGVKTQLNLEFYVGLPNSLSYTDSRGVYVFMLNATDYPYNYAMSPYMMTPSSGMTMMPQRQFYAQMPKPYGDCNVLEGNKLYDASLLPDRTLFDEVIATGYDYAQKTCIEFCEQHLAVKECGCLSPLINLTLPGYSRCLNGTQFLCANAFNTKFTFGDFIGDNCLPKCPLECTQRLFQPSILSYAYPTSSTYLSGIRNSSTFYALFGSQKDFSQSLGSNMLQVLVYYDNLAYTHIEEEAKMTAEDLLGILGGHLHLFLGMSMLSFVELGECVIVLAMTLRCRSTKQVETDTTPKEDIQNTQKKQTLLFTQQPIQVTEVAAKQMRKSPRQVTSQPVTVSKMVSRNQVRVPPASIEFSNSMKTRRR